MKRILNKLLYILLRNIAKFLSLIFFKLKVEGADKLPQKKPFIIASNHASFLDPVVIQASITTMISWIAKRDVYENIFLKPFHRIFNTIPINGSIERALKVLDSGQTVGIFPEGTRTPDGKLKDADVGVAILALRSGKAVVPVGVKGSFEAFGRHMKFFKFYPIVVRIGKPLSFEKVNGEVISEDILKNVKNKIMDRIKELIL